MVDHPAPEAAETLKPSEIFARTLRHFLAPIQAYMDDPDVVEVMINGPSEVYIEQKGQLVLTEARFDSEEALVAAIRNLLQYVGKRLTSDQPMTDARLPDGSRVHVAMPPCSRKGPCVTIRKFSPEGFKPEQMVEMGTLGQAALDYLRVAIQTEKNLLFVGGTSSGKTTLLNTLSDFVPARERIVVIEESSELRLVQPHIIQLETRDPDRYGRGRVTIRDLFRNSLRMRPDRIIVGEVRGGEALDMIQALTSGHGGSMTTMHADTPVDALNRLETMALMSDVAIPLNALRTQVAAAIDIVVQMARFHDASRRVTQIAEVLPVDSDYRYQLQDVFSLVLPKDSRKLDEGRLEWSGVRPRLMRDIQARLMAQEIASLEPLFADTQS